MTLHYVLLCKWKYSPRQTNLGFFFCMNQAPLDGSNGACFYISDSSSRKLATQMTAAAIRRMAHFRFCFQ